MMCLAEYKICQHLEASMRLLRPTVKVNTFSFSFPLNFLFDCPTFSTAEHQRCNLISKHYVMNLLCRFKWCNEVR